MAEQRHKFSPLTVSMKERVRRLRLDAGYSMTKGSELLGVSRKQLEDIETTRDYGCHLDIELLAKVKLVYNASIDGLVGELDSDIHSGFYTRMRNRKDS
jgi:transcriptional regulator with XRE-family HTH domain